MSAAGTAHWTGLVALAAGAAGAVPVALRAIVLGGRGTGRPEAITAVLAGAVAIAAGLLAVSRATAIAEEEIGDFLHGAQQAARIGAGVGVRVRVDVDPSTGAYEAVAGGALLVLAGAVSAVRPRESAPAQAERV